MGKTLSFGKGKGNIRHNNREYLTPNVDKDRVQDNVYLVRQDIEDAYRECFGQAIEDYNATQKRSDRKKSVPAYMDEIRRNQANRNGEKLFYEQVIGVGDMHDSGIVTHPEDAQTCKAILLDYFKEWQERNPNLHVFNAVLHMDEATPHLHVDYIPVGYGYKQGVQARNSLTKAFECMGIDSAKSKEDNATKKWQTRERERITEIAKEHGVEIDVLGIKRKDYTIDEYKAIVRDEKQALKQVKAPKPKRVNLPFGMALETNRAEVDKVFEYKAGVKKHAETYKQATKTAESVTEHATESIKAVKGIELSLEQERAELERLRRATEQEKAKALAELQTERDKYTQAYNEQLNLNQLYMNLKNAYQERGKEVETLKQENHSLRMQVASLKDSIKQSIEQAVAPLKEQIKAFQEKADMMARGQMTVLRAVRYVRDHFSGEVGASLLNATVAAGNQFLKEDGFEEYSQDREKSLGKSVAKHIDMDLTYKNGEEGKGVYTAKGVCVVNTDTLREARELLPNCHIKDGIDRGRTR
jgi:hypothetical protein